MSVQVRIPTPLRGATEGVAQVQLESPTIQQVIADLEGQFPGMKGRLRGPEGELRRFVNLYVNGEDIRFLQGLETPLKAGDEVSIVPAVAGGGG